MNLCVEAFKAKIFCGQYQTIKTAIRPRYFGYKVPKREFGSASVTLIEVNWPIRL